MHHIGQGCRTALWGLAAHAVPVALGVIGWLLVLTACATAPFTPSALPTALPTSTVHLPAVAHAGDIQPALPLRAAFYYPWFPEAWEQHGIYPYTNYTPSLGFYDGASLAVIQQHLLAMQYAKIKAGIISWWGQGTRSDERVPVILSATGDSHFRWSTYYEPEGQGNPTVDQITNDLSYLRDQYGGHRAHLRIDGRFVVFVYAQSPDGCEMATRWKQANTVGAFVVLKVFSGYRNCPDQPDGWHQYGPATAASNQVGYSYSISPGFWKVGESPRLTRDLTRWYGNVRDMVASGAPFQLVTTFNEWGEGTAVESATDWASASGYGAYLDALHTDGMGTEPQAEPPVRVRASEPTVTPVPPVPTPVPARVATPAPARATPTASRPTSVPTLKPPTQGDAILIGVGDISCDPLDANFNGGLGTKTNCQMKQTSDIVLEVSKTASVPVAVFVAGDTQYENGDYAKFVQSYEPTWGRLKSITFPAVGNHEYLTKNAEGYYRYFGAAAGDPKKGYYSYNLGAWHIVVINSMCTNVGGCTTGSMQERWLRADLAANPSACTAAYWHHPRYSSGQHGNFDAMADVWNALYDFGAELVIAGHDHNYERFAPQDAHGNADGARGIRSFVIGSGGKNLTRIATVKANSEVRNDNTYGVLKLDLRPDRYEWKFMPVAGKTFTDAGSEACH